MNRDATTLIAVLVAFVLVFGLVGGNDYEDAKIEEKAYCQNVKDGVHPDYKEIAKKVCPKY